MALYNDIVMDNFLNPKNVGELENPDGTGVYGSPVCGDMMQIQIKVDDDEKITDAIYACSLDAVPDCLRRKK